MSAEDVRAELAEVLAAHDAPVVCAHRGCFQLPDDWHWADGDDFADLHRAHVADLLAEYVATKEAEAWDVGQVDGYENRLFEDRGLSTDSDGDDYPITNPYRIAP